MHREKIIETIKAKQSFLCVGIDPDITKIPSHLLRKPDSILEFNKRIIDATSQFAVAYKPNLAFFEAFGDAAWNMLKQTFDYIPTGILKIADAKRADIGHSSAMYARALFDELGADVVTVNPYLGRDSVEPFLNKGAGKWTALLALTSNPGAGDFELLPLKNGLRLFEEVIAKSRAWGSAENMMYVVGATHSDYLSRIRTLAEEHFLLIPGVGAQGGSLEEVAREGMISDCGLIVNASRSIIYAGRGKDFDRAAAFAAEKLQKRMRELLIKYHVI